MICGQMFSQKQLRGGFIWAHGVRCLMVSRGLSPWWQESVVEEGTSHLGGQEAERKQQKRAKGTVSLRACLREPAFHEIPPLKFLSPLRLGHHLRAKLLIPQSLGDTSYLNYNNP